MDGWIIWDVFERREDERSETETNEQGALEEKEEEEINEAGLGKCSLFSFAYAWKQGTSGVKS